MGTAGSTRQQLRIEIETARMRHWWAKTEVKRGHPSLALVKFLQESLQELRALRCLAAGRATKRSQRLPANGQPQSLLAHGTAPIHDTLPVDVDLFENGQAHIKCPNWRRDWQPER
jgi:hypothetical protein